jgi:hypothetical protein
MNRLLVFLIGLLFTLALAIPAIADVDVYADITKDKNVVVNETITKYKFVYFDVTVDIPDSVKAAESSAIGNQENIGNWACENCAEKVSVLWNSVIDNDGLTNINQATGNMMNQGIDISIALDHYAPPPQDQGQEEPPEGGFAEAQASVEQNMELNVVSSTEILWRVADIDSSINDNTGITNVNQATGNMNNQMTAISLAVSLAGGVALSEADLGQAITYNTVTEYPTEPDLSGINKYDSVTNSVMGNNGITTVSQTCGNLNNQANIVSIAGAIGL